MSELLFSEKDAFASIEHSLTNHAPVNDSVVAAFEELREHAKALGLAMVMLCPDSRERSLAITKLEETVMWAVKAIAVHNYVKVLPPS